MVNLQGYSLLNTPGVYTRFPLSRSGRPSVLDLAFASSSLAHFLAAWGTPYESTGSDHVPILVSFATPALLPPRPAPDWARVDWPEVLKALKTMDIHPPPRFLTARALDTWFECHATRVRGVLSTHTPMKSPCPRSKPWWSKLLSALRKEHHSRTRANKNHPGPSSGAEMRAARSAYFKEVRRAKNKHWGDFLCSTDHRTVWQAKRIAAGAQVPRFPSLPGADSPEEVRDALIQHFFPARVPPPSNTLCPIFADVPPVTPEEIARVLSRSSPSSAPGPDTIPYSVWKTIYREIPDLLPALLSPLVERGYHPGSLKAAEGVVLDKPGKATYDTPASYRVIVLLETLSKILERLIANHLAAQAREIGMLHPNQCGSLAGVSSLHAATALTHEVATAQKLKLKASTLLLDIKGGFDSVRPSCLTGMLRERGISPYIVSWVRAFLSGRSCRLRFQGAPNSFVRVAVGTPQGSPVSPLLFVLYVAPLHKGTSTANTISFVDDLALTSVSSSHRHNIQLLQARFRKMSRKASKLGLSFSVPKTELIHWRTPKERTPPCRIPIHLGDGIFPPREEVRWLGY